MTDHLDRELDRIRDYADAFSLASAATDYCAWVTIEVSELPLCGLLAIEGERVATILTAAVLGERETSEQWWADNLGRGLLTRFDRFGTLTWYELPTKETFCWGVFFGVVENGVTLKVSCLFGD
jgi:hypothetical protein